MSIFNKEEVDKVKPYKKKNKKLNNSFYFLSPYQIALRLIIKFVSL